jgi:hypothetical protein
MFWFVDDSGPPELKAMTQEKIREVYGEPEVETVYVDFITHVMAEGDDITLGYHDTSFDPASRDDFRPSVILNNDGELVFVLDHFNNLLVVAVECDKEVTELFQHAAELVQMTFFGGFKLVPMREFIV